MKYFFVSLLSIFCITKEVSANSYEIIINGKRRLMSDEQNKIIPQELESACKIAKFFFEKIEIEKIKHGNGKVKEISTSNAKLSFDQSKKTEAIAMFKRIDTENRLAVLTISPFQYRSEMEVSDLFSFVNS